MNSFDAPAALRLTQRDLVRHLPSSGHSLSDGTAWGDKVIRVEGVDYTKLDALWQDGRDLHRLQPQVKVASLPAALRHLAHQRLVVKQRATGRSIHLREQSRRPLPKCTTASQVQPAHHGRPVASSGRRGSGSSPGALNRASSGRKNYRGRWGRPPRGRRRRPTQRRYSPHCPQRARCHKGRPAPRTPRPPPPSSPTPPRRRYRASGNERCGRRNLRQHGRHRVGICPRSERISKRLQGSGRIAAGRLVQSVHELLHVLRRGPGRADDSAEADACKKGPAVRCHQDVVHRRSAVRAPRGVQKRQGVEQRKPQRHHLTGAERAPSLKRRPQREGDRRRLADEDHTLAPRQSVDQ